MCFQYAGLKQFSASRVRPLTGVDVVAAAEAVAVAAREAVPVSLSLTESYTRVQRALTVLQRRWYLVRMKEKDMEQEKSRYLSVSQSVSSISICDRVRSKSSTKRCWSNSSMTFTLVTTLSLSLSRILPHRDSESNMSVFWIGAGGGWIGAEMSTQLRAIARESAAGNIKKSDLEATFAAMAASVDRAIASKYCTPAFSFLPSTRAPA